MIKIDLSGKTAIITGSARGIGRAIAEKLAEAGANIVVSDITAETGEVTAKEISEKYNVKTIFVEANVTKEEDNVKFVKDNLLGGRDTLPIGEFAIGTNTTAYITARKYGIEDKMPILIAEKTGPHFAVGDTCYSWSEEIRVYNPNGKEIVAKDNSCSLLRKEDVSKAYFNCHTDITVPYKELEEISVVTNEGKDIILLEDGRFVLPGTEVLNEPLDEAGF